MTGTTYQEFALAIAKAAHQSLMLKQPSLPSRRVTSRVRTGGDIWIYWRCNGRDDTSRVRDLSLGGLFVETMERKSVGSRAQIDFLVKEGQIRAEAVVLRVEPGLGLGLKFTAIHHQDSLRVVSLINRLYIP